MSLTIIEALKKKGSTGGNTIMEAIENLPDSGSGGGSDSGGGSVVFRVDPVIIENTEEYIINATYDDIALALHFGVTPIGVYNHAETEEEPEYTMHFMFMSCAKQPENNAFFCIAFAFGLDGMRQYTFKASSSSSYLKTYDEIDEPAS